MAQIQSYVEPPRLYRYRPSENLDREIQAIQEGYLFCAAFDDLNDPMEGLFASSKRLRNSDRYREIRSAIRDSKSHMGICSFSEVHNHELMWAHYATQFKGICIAYSLPRLLDSLANNVDFVRMYYNENVPIIGKTKKPANELARKILSYKNYRWLYEREWRMFAPQGKAFYTNRNCVMRVYVGSRMDPAHAHLVTSKLTPLKIKTITMSVKKYSIVFEND
jgi:hypothetical protein